MTDPRIGKTIDSYCGCCKLVLAHTIETVLKGKITRAHCNTCGAQHAFRAQPPGKKPAGRNRSSAGVAQPSDYEKLMRGQNPATAKPYEPSKRFKAAELIKHPTFGLGLVINLRESNKMDVLFPDGAKVLIHC